MDIPDWVPPAVAEIIPLFGGDEEQRAILDRLASDPRMRRVWLGLSAIKPDGMTCDDALRLTFSYAFYLACEKRPTTVRREYAERVRAAGGWGKYFVSANAMKESVVMVAHKPSDDPVVKAMQQSLVAWLMSQFGGPHLALAQTLTEIALDCKSTRMTGRLPYKPPPQKLQRAAGCR